jgi:Prokaryotic phospholipase A2/Peptidase inhibitor family I36
MGRQALEDAAMGERSAPVRAKGSARKMRRTVYLLMLCLLSLSGLNTAPADASFTRAELRARADSLMYGMSLNSFINERYDALPSNGTNPMEWSSDGCSVHIFGTAGFNDFFERACMRHDFGYRNLGNGFFKTPSLALDSTAASKARVDTNFRNDMYQLCENYPWGVGFCRSTADKYYEAVDSLGQAQTSFYKGECPTGGLCLFDDTNYEDRRVRLTSSEDNFNDIDFGDKTSSVKNASGYAWVIFDDSGYRDRKYCIAAGDQVSSLGATWDFNDKTSSAARLTTASCW